MAGWPLRITAQLDEHHAARAPDAGMPDVSHGRPLSIFSHGSRTRVSTLSAGKRRREANEDG